MRSYKDAVLNDNTVIYTRVILQFYRVADRDIGINIDPFANDTVRP
jgi:hypothetical protein